MNWWLRQQLNKVHSSALRRTIKTSLIFGLIIIYLAIGILVMKWVRAETIGSVTLDEIHADNVGRHTFWLQDTSEMYRRNWAFFGVLTWPIWFITKSISMIGTVLLWITTNVGKLAGE